MFGRYPVSILSNSMEPEIKTGALIINRTPPLATEIEIGDVITYTLATRTHGVVIITHRVFDIRERDGEFFFRTKGDNLTRADNFWVPYDDIIGIHTGTTLSYVGYAISFYSSLHGIISMAGCLLIYILYYLIVDTMKRAERNERKNALANK
jgi:signal peptidase